MKWYYVQAGQQVGPVSETDLANLAAAGTIKSDTLVWREGMPNWIPYSQIAGGAPSISPGSAASPPQMAAGPVGSAPINTFPSDQGSKVKGPAIFLIVLGGLGALLFVLKLIFLVVGSAMVRPQATGNPDIDRVIGMFSGGAGLFFDLISLAGSVVVILGGMRMLNLRSYGLCMAASIVAILPCVSPCCCLGIPAGIWALIVLAKPEVKAAFGQ